MSVAAEDDERGVRHPTQGISLDAVVGDGEVRAGAEAAGEHDDERGDGFDTKAAFGLVLALGSE